MTVTPDTTVYVSKYGRFHVSRYCAKSHDVTMSLREAAGEHDPCGSCIGQSEAKDVLESLLDAPINLE